MHAAAVPGETKASVFQNKHRWCKVASFMGALVTAIAPRLFAVEPSGGRGQLATKLAYVGILGLWVK